MGQKPSRPVPLYCARTNVVHWALLYGGVMFELFDDEDNPGRTLLHVTAIPGDRIVAVQKITNIEAQSLFHVLSIAREYVRQNPDYSILRQVDCQVFCCYVAGKLGVSPTENSRPLVASGFSSMTVEDWKDGHIEYDSFLDDRESFLEHIKKKPQKPPQQPPQQPPQPQDPSNRPINSLDDTQILNTISLGFLVGRLDLIESVKEEYQGSLIQIHTLLLQLGFPPEHPVCAALNDKNLRPRVIESLVHTSLPSTRRLLCLGRAGFFLAQYNALSKNGHWGSIEMLELARNSYTQVRVSDFEIFTHVDAHFEGLVQFWKDHYTAE